VYTSCVPVPTLPTINLPVFDGPLDLLLHLVREHRVDIADIPITVIADQYIAYINAMEERNLALAGEFFVMAATLLEIKTRMLLPKPPAEQTDEDELDPREALIERLRDYERFKELVGYFQELEEERGKLFLRDRPDIADMYRIPVEFGELAPSALVAALQQLLAEAEPEEHEVTSVRRQKMSLKLAMRMLMGKVAEGGKRGIDFVEAFPSPLVRLEIIMVFLAMLELLRQGKIRAKQMAPLAPIRIFLTTLGGSE